VESRKTEEQIAPVNADFDEIIIFRLSRVLGGRSEVLNTPIKEIMAYLELEQAKEKEARMSQFLNFFYANPYIDKKQRERYIKTLTKEDKKSRPKTFKTDYDQLKRLKDMQDKGGIQF
jgi:hypothetical protein